MYGYTIFHNDIAEKLISAVRRNESGHAYIFAGNNGIGKYEAALLFANALVCSATNTAPCGVCSACVQAKAKTNPDIIHITSEGKKSIGVDAIRNVSDDCAVKPFGTGKKIYIIDKAETMTEAAQNAFLKTLEEPPEYAVFILLCCNTDNLLETVLSRCSLIKFSRIKYDALKKYTSQKFGEQPDFIINLAEGNPGVVDAYMTDEDFRSLRENSVQMVKDLISHDALKSYTVAEFLEAHTDKTADILNFWTVLLRDMLFTAYAPQRIINSDITEFLNNQLITYGEKYIINAIEVLARAHEMHERDINGRLLGLYIALSIKNYA